MNFVMYPVLKGDSLRYNAGMMFTTMDQDNDRYPGRKGNCAAMLKGGWWYNKCTDSNLNGMDLRGRTNRKSGITWETWRGIGYSLKSVVMKVTERKR